MANEQMELVAARQRLGELMARMANMDPDAVGEMQEFLRSLPAEVLAQIEDDLSR